MLQGLEKKLNSDVWRSFAKVAIAAIDIGEVEHAKVMFTGLQHHLPDNLVSKVGFFLIAMSTEEYDAGLNHLNAAEEYSKEEEDTITVLKGILLHRNGESEAAINLLNLAQQSENKIVAAIGQDYLDTIS